MLISLQSKPRSGIAGSHRKVLSEGTAPCGCPQQCLSGLECCPRPRVLDTVSRSLRGALTVSRLSGTQPPIHVPSMATLTHKGTAESS